VKTYLKIMFNSEGSPPSEIKNQLLNLGFVETKGNSDFFYEWKGKTADINELVWFADKVHSTLKDNKVYFTIETI
jgi:hypothetical protein